MKIDCSITENFLKEWGRMCDSYTGNCSHCNIPNKSTHSCKFFILNDIKRSQEVVQKWSDENPQKTYLEDFLSKYPEAPLDIKGNPDFCVARLYKNFEAICDCTVCGTCWGKVMV